MRDIVLPIVAVALVALAALGARWRARRVVHRAHGEALIEHAARNAASAEAENRRALHEEAEAHGNFLAAKHGWDERRRGIEIEHLKRKRMV